MWNTNVTLKVTLMYTVSYLPYWNTGQVDYVAGYPASFGADEHIAQWWST
jgi:hypothetical protein